MSGAHPTDSSTAETHPVRRRSTPSQPRDHPPDKTPANNQHPRGIDKLNRRQGPWFRPAQPTGRADGSTDVRGRGFDKLNRRRRGSTDGAGAQPTIWSSSSARRARTTRRPTLEAVVSSRPLRGLPVLSHDEGLNQRWWRPWFRQAQPTGVWFRQAQPTGEEAQPTGEGAQPTGGAVVSTGSTDGRGAVVSTSLS